MFDTCYVLFKDKIREYVTRKVYGRAANPTMHPKIRTTLEIKDSLKKNHSIDHHPGLNFDEQDLLIHPYILGVWLGDYHSLLSTHKLKQNKHIPDIYLRDSHDQRLALLQGLMDIDGDVESNGNCEFCSVKKLYRIFRLFDQYKAKDVHRVGYILQYFNRIAVILHRAVNVYTAAFHRWSGNLLIPAILQCAFRTKLTVTTVQRKSLIVPGKEDVSLKRVDDTRGTPCDDLYPI